MKTRKMNKIALLDIPFNLAVIVALIYRFRMIMQSGLQAAVDADNGGIVIMAGAVLLLIMGLGFDLKCLLSDKDSYGYNNAFVVGSFIIKVMAVFAFIVYRLIV